jgi:hypothetical protein
MVDGVELGPGCPGLGRQALGEAPFAGAAFPTTETRRMEPLRPKGATGDVGHWLAWHDGRGR